MRRLGVSEDEFSQYKDEYTALYLKLEQDLIALCIGKVLAADPDCLSDEARDSFERVLEAAREAETYREVITQKGEMQKLLVLHAIEYSPGVHNSVNDGTSFNTAVRVAELQSELNNINEQMRNAPGNEQLRARYINKVTELKAVQREALLEQPGGEEAARAEDERNAMIRAALGQVLEHRNAGQRAAAQIPLVPARGDMPAFLLEIGPGAGLFGRPQQPPQEERVEGERRDDDSDAEVEDAGSRPGSPGAL